MPPPDPLPELVGIAGSLRRQSTSAAVLRALFAGLQDKARTRICDIGVLPHYNADLDPPGPEVEAFKQAITAADGVVVATPEYNYSIPGVLKNAIDWASRPAYKSVFRGKPVLVLSVSGGALGGVRAQAHLKYVLNAMLAEVFAWQEMVVPKAGEKVRDDRFTDPAVEAFLGEAASAFVGQLQERRAVAGKV